MEQKKKEVISFSYIQFPSVLFLYQGPISPTKTVQEQREKHQDQNFLLQNLIMGRNPSWFHCKNNWTE